MDQVLQNHQLLQDHFLVSCCNRFDIASRSVIGYDDAVAVVSVISLLLAGKNIITLMCPVNFHLIFLTDEQSWREVEKTVVHSMGE